MISKLRKFGQQNLESLTKRKGLAFGLILAAAGVIFIGRQTVWKPQTQVNYQTAVVKRGTLVSTVSASGQIVITNRMAVVTQASGQVKQIFVKEGDNVSAGQALVELILDASGQQKSAQAWAAYLQAKTMQSAALASAYSLQSTMYSKWKTYTDLSTNSTYQNPDGSPNTANRLLPQFTIAQDDWLAAEANYKNQESVIEQNRAAVVSAWVAYQLVAPVVTAPVSGTVSDLTVTPGLVLTNSTQPLASIVANTLPVALVNVAEVDVRNVKPGQKVTLTVDAFPDKTFMASVVGINRTGVVSSGVTNYPTIIQLESANAELLPNMSVSANIVVAAKQDVLLVPATAVNIQGNQSAVRVLAQGKVHQVTVVTGLATETQTEIVSGLSEGETVITGLRNATSAGTSPFSTFRIGGFGGGAGLRPGGTGAAR